MLARPGHHGARAFALVFFVFSATALGQVLTPFEPVSPDGFEVRVDGILSAEGATVTRRGELAFVQPQAGAREVRLFVGGKLVRTLAVGPPVTVVSLALSPALPVKNRERTAVLEITLGGTESAPPVLRASVGHFEGLALVGPGRFRATYVLPETRFPEVAVIVAFSAWPHAQATHGAVGVLRVPLASAIEVPGKAERGAQVRLIIGGQTFGPVRAADDGSFRLPAVVPPGFGVAQSRATDRVGNSRTTQVDLMVPPTNQLACVVTPDHLPADGVAQARVLCATSDRFGARATGARVALTTSAGRLSAVRELGDGVLEWTWTTPTERGVGTVAFEAAWRASGVDSKVASTLTLGQGPVASVRQVSGEPLVHLGSTWRSSLQGLDAQGHTVADFVVVSNTPGVTADGGAVAWAPTGAPREERIMLRAFGPMGFEPARLLAWVEDGGVGAAVTDLSGRPVAAQPLALDEQSLQTGPDGVVWLGVPADGEHELRHLRWPGLRVRLVLAHGALLFPPANRPPRLEVEQVVRVAPAVPVNVRLERDGAGFSWWLEDAAGVVLTGRPVSVTVDQVTQLATSDNPQRVIGSAVTVVDVETQVAATGATQ
jgi:hypothetical protein